jgi:5-methylcytosine-specific restriction endonuclease McrBC regulatory subunit McrC
MVLGDSSLLDAAGTTGAAVFLIDMNKAFEDFVASRLSRYLHGQLHVGSQKPDHLDNAGHAPTPPPTAAARGCHRR